MVGKPAPQKPVTSPTSPAGAAANVTPRPNPEVASSAPLNRNSPSPASAGSMADVSSGGGSAGRSRRRSTESREKAAERLVSLDAFRGFIMMMLAASGFGLLAFSRIDESSAVWQSHDRAFWQRIGFHFDHPAWISSFDLYKVSFWDLIQPAFMFMVGAAMPFSNRRREAQGEGFWGRACHALIRAVALVLMGVFLYSMGHERTNWIFPNVLCQIGLGYFFAWLLQHLRVAYQIIALILILVGYWGWFASSPPPVDYDYAAVNANAEKGEVLEGRFAPWSKNANAAFFFDNWLLPKLRSEPKTTDASAALNASTGDWRLVAMPLQETPSDEAKKAETSDSPALASPPVDSMPPGVDAASEGDHEPAANASPEPPGPPAPGWFRQLFLSNTEPYEFNGGGYTTLNFVPSIGTTLLGILCGQLLLRPQMSRWAKLGLLLAIAAGCLGLGIAAGQTVCPVVKRIWTPSWVLFSGGYVIAMLALFYFLFDILPLRLLAFPLVVVGMNSILIYMLGQTISGWMRESVVKVHLAGMIENVFGPKALDPLWYGPITLPTTVFLLYWLFLLWLYRQRIFLRL